MPVLVKNHYFYYRFPGDELRDRMSVMSTTLQDQCSDEGNALALRRKHR